MLGNCGERSSVSTPERLPGGCFGGGVLTWAVWSSGHRSAGLGLQRPAALGLSPHLEVKNRRDTLWGHICDSASPYSGQRQWLFWAIVCHLLPPRPPAATIAALGGDSAQPFLVPLEITYSFVHQFVWSLADPICLLRQLLPDIHCPPFRSTFIYFKYLLVLLTAF